MGCTTSSADLGKPNPDQIDISHFTIIRQIGKGGFAEVYVARRKTGAKELVAIKKMDKLTLLRIKDGNDGKRGGAKGSTVRLSSTVWTERHVWSRIASPFLVPLLHAFQDENHLYYVMPLLSAGDLGSYIENFGVLSENSVRFYAAEIVLALEALHSMGIAYRDLKPNNILMWSDGHICLTDFGLCRAVPASGDGLTELKTQIGTRGYQAPELFGKEGHSYPVDFFALGVTLYRLLTGAKLFPPKKSKFMAQLVVPLTHVAMRPFEDLSVQEAYYKVMAEKGTNVDTIKVVRTGIRAAPKQAAGNGNGNGNGTRRRASTGTALGSPSRQLDKYEAKGGGGADGGGGNGGGGGGKGKGGSSGAGDYVSFSLSREAHDLIAQLVDVVPANRLGTRSRTTRTMAASTPKFARPPNTPLAGGLVTPSMRAAGLGAAGSGSGASGDDDVVGLGAAASGGSVRPGSMGASSRDMLNGMGGSRRKLEAAANASGGPLTALALNGGGAVVAGKDDDYSVSDGSDAMDSEGVGAVEIQRRFNGAAASPVMMAVPRQAGTPRDEEKGARPQPSPLGSPGAGAPSLPSPSAAGPAPGGGDQKRGKSLRANGYRGAGGGGAAGTPMNKPSPKGGKPVKVSRKASNAGGVIRGKDENGQWLGLHAGFAQIKNHPFFAGIDWDAMADVRVPPPIVPRLNVACLEQTFKAVPLPKARRDGTVIKKLSQDEQALFANFEVNVAIAGNPVLSNPFFFSAHDAMPGGYQVVAPGSGSEMPGYKPPSAASSAAAAAASPSDAGH